MGILAPEPPAFAQKMCFGHQLFKNMITYTVWKFRKSKITHQKNEIEIERARHCLSSKSAQRETVSLSTFLIASPFEIDPERSHLSGANH